MGLVLLLLIFQNQGFDRLSEFPKIREAIIVSADGYCRLVDLKLWEEGWPGLDSGSLKIETSQSKCSQYICFSPSPLTSRERV